MVEDRAGIVRLLDVARNVNGAVSGTVTHSISLFPYVRFGLDYHTYPNLGFYQYRETRHSLDTEAWH